MSFGSKAPRDLRKAPGAIKGFAGSSYGSAASAQTYGSWGGYDMSGFGGSYGANYGQTPEVGYDTSSNDPNLVKARIFVGNINTNVVNREELIQMYMAYGQVIGMTVFKGYAFVQFADEQQALTAVSCTNKTMMHGQQMDVKLSATHRAGQSNLKRLPTAPAGNVLKRPAVEAATTNNTTSSVSSDTVKRMKMAFLTQKEKNTTEIKKDMMKPEDFFKHTLQDTMICGNCHEVFNDFVKYRDHRKESCQLPTPKPEGEPSTLYCFVCKEAFEYSWPLLTHLEAKHHLTVYHLTPDEKKDTNVKTDTTDS